MRNNIIKFSVLAAICFAALIIGAPALVIFFGIWGTLCTVWIAICLLSLLGLVVFYSFRWIQTKFPNLHKGLKATAISAAAFVVVIAFVYGCFMLSTHFANLYKTPMASIGTVTVNETPAPSTTPEPTIAPTKSTNNSDSQSSSQSTQKPEKKHHKSTVKPTPKPTVAPTPKPTQKPVVKPTPKPTQKPVVRCTPQPTIAPSATKPPQAFDASKIIGADGQFWKLDESSKTLTWIGLEDGSVDVHQGSVELLALIQKGYTFKFKTTVPGTIIISNGTINGFNYTDPSTSKSIAVSAGSFTITSPGNVGGFRWTPQQGYGWRK